MHMGLTVRNPDCVACKQQGVDQPAHPRSLVSAFGFGFMKSKVTRSVISLLFFVVVSKMINPLATAPECDLY